MSHAQHLRRPSNALRRSIAVALGLALLGASTLAGAETAKEKELEARVAELEKLVQQLVAEKKAAPAAVAAPAAAGTVAAAPAEARCEGHPAGHDPAERSPRHQLRADGLRQGRRPVDRHLRTANCAENNTARDFYVPGRDAGRRPRRRHGLRRACQADAHQLRHRHDPRGRRQALDPLRDRLLRLDHGRPARHEHLRAGPAPCVRAVARVAGRPDLDQLPGRRRCCPTPSTSSARRTARVFVRQPQVRYTKGGLSLAVENPADDHHAVRWRPGGNAPADHRDRRQLLPGPHRPLHLEGHLGPCLASPASHANSSTRRPAPARSTPAPGRWPAACPASS